MKKKLSILLVLAMSVMALSACGDNEATTESGTESSTELAVFTPSVEMVKVEGDSLDISTYPVEEYVTLGEYKGITLQVAPKAEVTEEEIESALMNYYYQHGNYYLTAEDFRAEGTVKETDITLIDYEGKKDGVAFDGGTAQDAVLGIGSNSFIDGFEDGLVGVAVGETVDLNLTFPESYGNADLAGQDVVFTVTVKGLASLDDDTIKKFELPDIETVEDYREAVTYMLDYDAESVYYRNLNTAVSDALLEACPVTKIPENIFNQQKEYAKEQLSYEASGYGMDGETYANVFSGMSLDDYASVIAENATIQAVIFQAIANAENVSITQEEIDTFVTQYVEDFGPQYGIDSVEAFYEQNSKEDVKAVLLQEKIIALVTENATISEKE